MFRRNADDILGAGKDVRGRRQTENKVPQAAADYSAIYIKRGDNISANIDHSLDQLHLNSILLSDTASDFGNVTDHTVVLWLISAEAPGMPAYIIIGCSRAEEFSGLHIHNHR